MYRKRPAHKHKLTKDKRQIFQNLDKKDYETAGRLDFDKKGLERGEVWIGDEESVDFFVDPDMEVDYHTHPRTKYKYLNKLNKFPSKEDVVAIHDTAGQYSLIFSQGSAMGMKKRKNFRLNRNKLDKIEKGLRKDALHMTDRQLMKKYKPKYKDVGLDIEMHGKGDITLPIKIVEPRKGKLVHLEGKG